MNNVLKPSKKIFLISGIILFIYGLLEIIVSTNHQSFVFIFSLLPLTYSYVFEHVTEDERSKWIRNNSIKISLFGALISLLICLILREVYSLDYLFIIFSSIVITFCGAFLYFAKTT